jgi:hypothetical protein
MRCKEALVSSLKNYNIKVTSFCDLESSEEIQVNVKFGDYCELVYFSKSTVHAVIRLQRWPKNPEKLAALAGRFWHDSRFWIFNKKGKFLTLPFEK